MSFQLCTSRLPSRKRKILTEQPSLVATMKGSSARMRSLLEYVCPGCLPCTLVDVSVRTVVLLGIISPHSGMSHLKCCFAVMLVHCKYAKLHVFMSKMTVYRIFINWKFERFWDMTCKLLAATDVSQQVDTSIFRMVTDIPGRSSSRCINK
jgi:hypothetical protein